MKSKVICLGPWQLNPTELVSGLVQEDKEVVLQICSLWGQGGGLEVFPSLFPRIFAKLGILNGDEGGHI